MRTEATSTKHTTTRCLRRRNILWKFSFLFATASLLYQYSIERRLFVKTMDYATSLGEYLPGLGDHTTIPFVLGDSSYFTGVQHRGGWKSVINHLIGQTQVLETRGSVKEAMAAVSLSENKLLMVDSSEAWFIPNKPKVIDVPWVGITHVVPDAPPHWDELHASLKYILESPEFQESLPYCQAIVVLSDYVVDYVQERVKNNPVKVCSMHHPIAVEDGAISYDPQVDLETAIQNGPVVLLGQQYRRIATIHRIKAENRDKLWLPGQAQQDKYLRYKMEKDLEIEGVQIDQSVIVKYTNSFEEYDRIVRQSIVIVDLWAATANNAVLEAIALNIPIFVRNLPGTAQYLGADYPLLFSEFEQLQNWLSNTSALKDLMLEGHLYLKTMNKTKLSLNAFSQNLLNCAQAPFPSHWPEQDYSNFTIHG